MSTPTIRRAEAGTTEAVWVRYTLIGISLVFLFLFLVLPLAAVFAEALRKGFDAYWEALKEPDAWSAIRLTLITALIAVPLIWYLVYLPHGALPNTNSKVNRC